MRRSSLGRLKDSIRALSRRALRRSSREINSEEKRVASPREPIDLLNILKERVEDVQTLDVYDVAKALENELYLEYNYTRLIKERGKHIR